MTGDPAYGNPHAVLPGCDWDVRFGPTIIMRRSGVCSAMPGRREGVGDPAYERYTHRHRAVIKMPG